jgi:hypothetical protein
MSRRKPPTSIEGDKVFLVRVNSDFFAGFNGYGQPLGVPAPCRGVHLSYRDADTIVQKLLGLGYANVAVSDLEGNVADLATIERARIGREQRMRDFWGEA